MLSKREEKASVVASDENNINDDRIIPKTPTTTPPKHKSKDLTLRVREEAMQDLKELIEQLPPELQQRCDL